MSIMGEPRYFANIGPKTGPILYRDGHDAIGVHEFPDSDTEHLNMPIGIALGTR